MLKRNYTDLAAQAAEHGDAVAAEAIEELERKGLLRHYGGQAARYLGDQVATRVRDLDLSAKTPWQLGARAISKVPPSVAITAAVIGPSIAAHRFVDRTIDMSREGGIHNPETAGVARLEQAYHLGRTPMTDRFTSFTATKHANAGARAASSSALDAISPLIKRLLYKTKDPEVVTEAVRNAAEIKARRRAMAAIPTIDEFRDEVAKSLGAVRDPKNPNRFVLRKNPNEDVTTSVMNRAQEVHRNRTDARYMNEVDSLQDSIAASMGAQRNPENYDEFIVPGEETLALGRAGALAAGGLGLGVTLDALSGDPFSPIGTEIERRLFPIESRVEGREQFAQGFFSQAGKQLGKNLVDTATGAVQAGVGGALMLPALSKSRDKALQVIEQDPLLSQASTADKDMLLRAYDSMQRYAPSLSKDEFATRNYLRESLMASNGPDYSTIGNLARTERMITGDKNK